MTELGAPAQHKVDAVRLLLTAARRDWYEIRVIDLPRAGMALHARAVVLIPAPTIALLSAAELQALVAHEIGHEYVWTEWHRAHQRADQERLKELELICDAIAAVTLPPAGNGFVQSDRCHREGRAIQPATVWVGHQREELSNCR